MYVSIYRDLKQLILKEVEVFYEHEKGSALATMKDVLKSIVSKALETNDPNIIYKTCKDFIGFATAVSVLCLFKKLNGHPILTTSQILELAKDV